MTTDLLVLGGTVVNATGSSRVDVAVEGGRIGAAALRDRALLEHCAEVLNGVVPALVAVG